MEIKFNLRLQNYSEYLFNYFLKCLRKDKINRVVVSGGNTPIVFFSYLNKNIRKLDEYKIEFYWLDERSVDFTSTQSNYGNFIRMINIPDNKNIYTFPMYFSSNTIEENINRYLNIINDILSNGENFDFGILGMGMDGHVASIFDLDSIDKGELLLKTTDSNGLDRISMNFPLINRIKKKYFIV